MNPPDTRLDALVRQVIDSHLKWGSPDRDDEHQPPDLATDYAARVVALLVEQAGGRVEIALADIETVPARLVVLPVTSGDRITFEVRRLLTDELDGATPRDISER